MNDDDFWNTILGNDGGGSSVTSFANGLGTGPSAGLPFHLVPSIARFDGTGLPADILATLPPPRRNPSGATWLSEMMNSGLVPASAIASLLPQMGDTASVSSVSPMTQPQANPPAQSAAFLPSSIDEPIFLTDQPAPADPDKGQHAMDALNAELARQKILRTNYPDSQSALNAWSDAAIPLQQQFGTELASKLFHTADGWQVGSAYSNGSHCGEGQPCWTSPILGGDVDDGIYYGYIHTHPTDFGGLDASDEYSARALLGGGNAYVALPNGQINGWTPEMNLTPSNAPGTNQIILRTPIR